MQLNFLDEGDVGAPQGSKKKTAAKGKKKTEIDSDLFGGLPEISVSKAKKAVDKVESHTPEIEKSDSAFKTISEVAGILSVPQHVLRFWETRFSQIKPLKMGGGRRYYRPEDVDILKKVYNLLYKEGYTIKGAKKAFIQKFEEREKRAEVRSIQDENKRTSLTDKQIKQATAILKEMLAMRETIRNYVA